MIKLSFNDMLGKGWDSAKQESFCWLMFEQGDPQFWWVPEVYRKHGHAWDWDPKRDNMGRYKSKAFSSYSIETLKKVAHSLDEKQLFTFADAIDSILIAIANNPDDSDDSDYPEAEIVEDEPKDEPKDEPEKYEIVDPSEAETLTPGIPGVILKKKPKKPGPATLPLGGVSPLSRKLPPEKQWQIDERRKMFVKPKTESALRNLYIKLAMKNAPEANELKEILNIIKGM